ncbi:DNA polymerase III subunit alpha [Chrysiogenes arsenatis]|uniref:DNA polymerase III subunit alpha n=1 Tax=Chrysiogenes arsenatis TaxID=309797 RepID=UPI0004240D03|nr:DNA polymerase III subunit alpha [Chrysiogenes arsenatis]
MDFVHLHLHTQYSLLDGAIKIKELVKKCQDEGMKSIAITDHGCMFGVLDFYKQCTKGGIKPILGCEVYVAPGGMLEKRNAEGVYEGAFHLVLLAENEVGYRNLIYMVSEAYMKGFYYKPRVDKELLRQHSEGIIALSACLGGEVPNLLLAGKRDVARQSALEYNSIFGQGNFFLEIQENGMEAQRDVNLQVIALADELGIPLVATNDCHYLRREDAKAHDILLCIQTQSAFDDQKRFRFDSDQLYVKSPAEMHRDFAAYPEALANTVKIAERCNVTLEFGQVYLPKYPVPEGHDLNSFIRHMSREGLAERFEQFETLNITVDKELYRERLELEIDVIISMGFPGYFVIVADFIQWAKRNDIPVGPGRGSAAGSLVAYALKITDIDPIPYNLLFERFLNPERVSMPDIDIDFCMNRRGEVIEYVREKYGRENVCQIITYGALLAKGVLRDVARVLGLPYADGDKLSKLVPDKLGISLREAIDMEPKLASTAAAMPHGENLMQYALALEGLYRQAGMHAAGVVITDEPIHTYAPLYRGPEGEAICQFDKDQAESIGLVKFDFLGLKTLTVIDDACRLIAQTQKLPQKFDIAAIPMDDQKAYDLLCAGKTTGVFQLESGGMKNLIVKLRPSTFEDIIALVALYRPGPLGSGMIDDFVNRKHGIAEATYSLSALEPILKDTYGVIVYQEQVMQIARTLAGYSLGGADLLRRAMGKKKAEEMAKHKEIFLYGDGKSTPGAQALGFDVKKAEDIFDLMAFFAEYGFNKSHSAAYALIAYQTAYLKAHYPSEFMAALMSSEMDNTDKVVHFINECREMGILVQPPDVNKSGRSFSVDDDGQTIIFGLTAIKNVGGKAVEEIIHERETAGMYRSLYHFTDRIDLRNVNKRVVENLIKCGAFDALHANRRQAFEAVESAFSRGQAVQKERESGQLSLFAVEEETHSWDESGEEYADVPDWDASQRLTAEKETLGFYITGHPLQRYEKHLQCFTTSIAALDEMEAEQKVRLGGLLSSVQIKMTKTGKKMAVLIVEDVSGKCEAIVFPKTYEHIYEHLHVDNILIFEGKVNARDNGKNIAIEKVYTLSDAQKAFTKRVELSIDTERFSTELFTQLKQAVEQYRGEKPVIVRLHHEPEWEAIFQTNLAITPNTDLLIRLEEMLGSDAIAFTA